MKLSEAIRLVRQQYLADGLAASFFAINDGLCDDFACSVIQLMGGEACAGSLYDVCNENFMHGVDGDECGDDVWDWKLLKKHWSIVPPEWLTKKDFLEIGFGGHVWLTDGCLHYDAECPDGVRSFFELPLFRRYIVEELRGRGIRAEDVVTVDVLPPPVCPIPNPVKS